MLTTEQVKKIAEYMGVKTEIVGGKLLTLSDKGFSLGFDAQYGVEFSPCEDDINHQVFKALVDECKKRKLKIIIEDGEIFINKIVGEPFFYSPKFNNEPICLAYLAVMESK